MSIQDILAGNLQSLMPARSQGNWDTAGLAQREITRAEIKTLDPAAQATPEAQQAAPAAPEQSTGGIVNAVDTQGMAGRLSEMVNHSASMINNMVSPSSAAMQALSQSSDGGSKVWETLSRQFRGQADSPAAMADAATVQADLAARSEVFRTSGELAIKSAMFNADMVSTLFKNSG